MSERRNTWQKTAVLEQLSNTDEFVSAQELHQKISQSGKKLGLTTVYRALTEMVEQGMADSLSISDGEMRYRICTPEHHHHLICRVCGKTVEFDMPGFEELALQVAKANGFTELSHEIELFGVCKDCS
ncbi:MAG: transcriptional repressor [Aquiluna sp.]|nr:transcriptional repressor [Actinomycetota bacterium]MDC0912168.1 transcriptional repressor [Aquiluna sp.]NCV35608.1 transcriptional repressor [Actinomycetota bacterium]NCV98062.1 transcriptional repressor [Actinomycetota bacterium]NCW28951.1 transcriptional repressor [Actinomycetota bacterium]